MNRLEYFRRSLTKISPKSWEYFIVSRVIHRLDDLDIEFITQQLVRRPDGTRAMTDLFFPQFALHLEVDEPFHKKCVAPDALRERDIITITGHAFTRIDVSDKSDIKEICAKVENFIETLRQKKQEQVEAGCFNPWNPEERYRSGPVIARGYLDVEDNVAFQRQDEAMKCFGFKGKGWQKGAWDIPDGSADWLWFPRLYRHNNLWKNELSPDGKTISQHVLTSEAQASNRKALEQERGMLKERSVIVFAKSKDNLGTNLLRYTGTFRMDREISSGEALIYRRIATREKIR